jgi:glycosyltransferase involved in cell wall biosynthesis
MGKDLILNNDTNVQPLLSICLICYNHEKFIKAALEGISNQQMNFNWELLIADDCSTDSSRKIILDFIENNGINARLFFPDVNTRVKIWKEMLDSSKGKYKAHIDGDDYWIDNLKCQKQVDFLENNPDVSFCFTNGFSFFDRNVNELKRLIDTDISILKTDFLDFLSKGGLVPHSSKIWRSSADIQEWPKWVLDDPFKPDYFLNLIHLKSGKMALLNFDSFRYRIHSASMLNENSQIRFIERGITYTNNLRSFYAPQFDGIFKDCLSWHYADYAEELLKNKSYSKGLAYIYRSFAIDTKKSPKKLFKIIVSSTKLLVPQEIKKVLKSPFRIKKGI